MLDPSCWPREHKAEGAITGTLPVSHSESGFPGFPIALGKPFVVWMRQSSLQAGQSHWFLPIALTCSGGSCWKIRLDFPKHLWGQTSVLWDNTGSWCWMQREPLDASGLFLCAEDVSTTAVLGRSLRLLNPVDFPAELPGLALQSRTHRNVLFSILVGSLLAFPPPRQAQNIGRIGRVVPLETTSLA